MLPINFLVQNIPQENTTQLEIEKNLKIYKKIIKNHPIQYDHQKVKKEKSRAEYNYELMQYEYYNSRKKLVRKLMQKTSPKEPCNVPQEEIFEYFNSRWSKPNNKVLEDYGPNINQETQHKLDDEYSAAITKDDVEQSIKGMSIDTGQGLDHVSMRSIKKLNCSEIIATIGTVMQKWNLVPTSFRKAHTILFYKKGR